MMTKSSLMNFLDRWTMQAINLIYRTKDEINQLQMANPDETVLCSFRGKGRETHIDEQIGMGYNWAFARKGQFMLTDKRVVFCKWNIEIEQIERAEYCKYPGFINNVLALKITTKDKRSYQIGTIYEPKLFEQTVLDFKEINPSALLSLVGMGWRVFILGALVWFAIRYFA